MRGPQGLLSWVFAASFVCQSLAADQPELLQKIRESHAVRDNSLRTLHFVEKQIDSTQIRQFNWRVSG